MISSNPKNRCTGRILAQVVVVFAWESRSKKIHWYVHVSVQGVWVRSTSLVWKNGLTQKNMFMMGHVWQVTFGRRWNVSYVRSHLRGRWGRLYLALWSSICRMVKESMTSTEDRIIWFWSQSIRCLRKWCTCLTCAMKISELDAQLILIWRLLISAFHALTLSLKLKMVNYLLKTMAQNLEHLSKFKDHFQYYIQDPTEPQNPHLYKLDALCSSWICTLLRTFNTFATQFKEEITLVTMVQVHTFVCVRIISQYQKNFINLIIKKWNKIPKNLSLKMKKVQKLGVVSIP